MGGLVVKDLLVSAKAQTDERLRRWGPGCGAFRAATRAGAWWARSRRLPPLWLSLHKRRIVLPVLAAAGSTLTQQARCFTRCRTPARASLTGAGERLGLGVHGLAGARQGVRWTCLPVPCCEPRAACALSRCRLQGPQGQAAKVNPVLFCPPARRYLRYIGGAPAKHVQQLKTTGPHLEVGRRRGPGAPACPGVAGTAVTLARPTRAASSLAPALLGLLAWPPCLVASCRTTAHPLPWPTPTRLRQELNAAVRAMCKSGQLPVLSFSEGQPTKLGYIPTHVVPHESAYPG